MNQFNVKKIHNITKNFVIIVSLFLSIGVDASPMMTWGTIEGTPLHLDTDIVATPGPVFKIPKTPRREVLAHRLAEKASKGQSEKRKFALEKTSLLIKRFVNYCY